MKSAVSLTDGGLLCETGGFSVDPWKPARRAVITHVHSDHAREGSGEYYCSSESVELMRRRIGPDAVVYGKPYGEKFKLGEAEVSFHPAGHILGSSQVRIEVDGEVWVVSGDYKRDLDPTCKAFEVVPCDHFITEATFALPIYQWDPTELIAKQIYDWWMENRAAGKASVLFCYSLGKAQRVLAELLRYTNETVYTHGATENLTEAYRKAGVKMVPTVRVGEAKPAKSGEKNYAGDLILAPPGAGGSVWMRRFGDCETAFASGWMRVRGARRRRGHDRGFVLSDHADWKGLVRTCQETGAKKVWVTHGNAEVLSRYLREIGIEAENLSKLFHVPFSDSGAGAEGDAEVNPDAENLAS